MKHLGWHAVAAVALLCGPGSSHGTPNPSHRVSRRTARLQANYQQSVRAELAAVTKTQGLLADKLAVRHAEMKQRVRTMYKLSRASFPRLWFEPSERRNVAKWLGAARRITNRDQGELKLLHEEIRVANAAQARLQAVVKETLGKVPKQHSLRSPLAEVRIVAAYGEYKGPSRRVRLRRRGIELAAASGEPVFAPAPGRVRYAGPISGLGQGIILDHDGYWSVLGHLQALKFSQGDEVVTDSVIGHAATQRVYLEVRLAIGSVGQAVDPAPLLP